MHGDSASDQCRSAQTQRPGRDHFRRAFLGRPVSATRSRIAFILEIFGKWAGIGHGRIVWHRLKPGCRPAGAGRAALPARPKGLMQRLATFAAMPHSAKLRTGSSQGKEVLSELSTRWSNYAMPSVSEGSDYMPVCPKIDPTPMNAIRVEPVVPALPAVLPRSIRPMRPSKNRLHFSNGHAFPDLVGIRILSQREAAEVEIEQIRSSQIAQ